MRSINAIAFVILILGNLSIISEAKRYDESRRQSTEESEDENLLRREQPRKEESDVDLDDSSNEETKPKSAHDMGLWYWQTIEKNQKYCEVAINFVKETMPYLPKEGSNSKQDAAEIIKDFEKYMTNMLSKAVTNYNDYRENHKKLRLKANEISDFTLNNCRSAPLSFLAMVLNSASEATKIALIRHNEINKFLEIGEKELDMQSFPAMSMLMQSMQTADKSIIEKNMKRSKSSRITSEKRRSRKSKRRSFFSRNRSKSMNDMENGDLRVVREPKKKRRRSFNLFKRSSRGS